MIEVRTIRREEAEEFLGLLCDVFQLDFRRAEQVFFTEPMFDLGRKWALFEGPRMLSVLTTVPVEFGWGKGIGIAGVATRPERRREGLAALLLERVLERSAKNGEAFALLFAHDRRLYGRLGFEVIEPVVRARIAWENGSRVGEPLPVERVEAIYDAWAEGHPARLRRDARRWSFWRWNLRVSVAVPGGYACVEGETLREAVADPPLRPGGLALGARWFGLRSMAEQLGLPLAQAEDAMLLMGRRVPEPPQMFLTDQF
ncbi:MAG: GNAT family N-acetyltransferase [Fimbriimonadales bacterium]|nr:GNAT family N-acetyltransferase [Fimbriimonadales bacterium]